MELHSGSHVIEDSTPCHESMPKLRVSEQIRTLFQAGSLGALTDGQLLERYLSPESHCSEMAFATLVERHGPMVLGVCRRLLPDTHLAEDAFQATFLVLARRARSVRNHDSLGGWLHRVARRIAMRLRSTHDRRKAREQPASNRGGRRGICRPPRA